ncbi:MAG: BT_3928 family protein [Kordia sp.]|uniref:BT_3928 family protein n=1 Tax=Kordia sp. TaxID=1965332 RepID=UPI00385E243D
MENTGAEKDSKAAKIWKLIIKYKVIFFDTIYGKILTLLSQIFVGGLFIFSGFIKLNDPVGFSFKLTDYFAKDVLNLEFLSPYALWFAVFLVILEVVLGVMILLSLFKKPVLWSLLGLIVFFTFLTFYSAYFDKVTDCGCFGDFWKLTPWESFTKDVILLAAILILFMGIKHIKPIVSQKINIAITAVSLVACIFFGRHVLNHLPVFDFRAYKIGTNIMEGMSYPPDAKKDVVEYTWVFDVDGEEVGVVTETLGEEPKVEGGTYKTIRSEVIEKGYEPPIHDFYIENEERDNVVEAMMEEEKLVMIIVYSLDKVDEDGLFVVKAFTDRAIEAGYKVIGLSSSDPQELKDLSATMQFNFDFYNTDGTALKTTVRSNPGVLILEKGVITGKAHYNDFDNIKF